MWCWQDFTTNVTIDKKSACTLAGVASAAIASGSMGSLLHWWKCLWQDFMAIPKNTFGIECSTRQIWLWSFIFCSTKVWNGIIFCPLSNRCWLGKSYLVSEWCALTCFLLVPAVASESNAALCTLLFSLSHRERILMQWWNPFMFPWSVARYTGNNSALSGNSFKGRCENQWMAPISREILINKSEKYDYHWLQP